MKNKVIYFDNAATSFPKPEAVIKETLRCIKKYCGNPGRSGHRLSISASERVFSVREKIAEFIKSDNPESVVLTSGATFALNLAMKSGINNGSHILISDMEHNSVLRVAEELRVCRGVIYDVFDSDALPQSIEMLIRNNTTHIVSTLASNVNGKKTDLAALSDICKKYGIKLILDSSQLLGHEAVSLEGIEYDALCSAGHKALFGIAGVGFAVFKRTYLPRGIISGGSGNDSKNLNMPEGLPEKYEAGTLPLPAIASLGAGIDFINEYGIDKIALKLHEMTEYLSKGLRELKNIDLCDGRGGILAFTAKDMPSEELSRKLDDYGVCVRGGFHCAPLMHKKLGTYKHGAVRISLSCLNTKKEISDFLNITEHILRVK